MRARHLIRRQARRTRQSLRRLLLHKIRPKIRLPLLLLKASRRKLTNLLRSRLLRLRLLK